MRFPRRLLWSICPLIVILLVAFQTPGLAGRVTSQEPTPQPESKPEELVLSTLEGAVDVAAGYYHTCVITTSGGVKCWGMNDNGQLGNGTETYAATPVDVLGLHSKIISLAAGEEHTCAVTVDGKALCWGRNYFGQLGDGTNEDRLTPIEVVDLPQDIVAVGAGDWFTCALSEQSGVYCWGDNNYNHLGDGSGEDSLTPVPVLGLSSTVQSIGVGEMSACALKEDGSIVCWGATGFLGLEGFDNGPLTVPGMEGGVNLLSVGLMHTCVLKGSQVFCWGGNQFGQLGDGQKTRVQIAPVPASGIAGQVQSLASGGYHTCALTDDGVYCWGGNTYGQLGDGSNTDRLSPVKVQGLSGNPTVISAGVWHTCAVLENNTVECWGLDRAGLLGSGRLMTEQLVPVQVTGLSEGVTAISAGEISTCAVLQAGGVRCWGINDSLGLALEVLDDNPINPGIPQEIESLVGEYQGVVVGESHACALSRSGGVTCWGSNYYGQLGDGTDERAETPVAVLGLSSGVTILAAGDDHTCALKDDGSVVCWGQNYSGRLGDGSEEHRFSPVTVIGLSGGIRSLFAGEDNTCVITQEGELYCWGSSINGKLIPGSWGDETTAQRITGIDGAITDVALGSNHTCAILYGGDVWCWGSNELGQLGDGTVEERESAVRVSGLGSAQVIAAGGDYTCALTKGDDLYCWGIYQSQTFDPDQPPQFSTLPVKIEGTPRSISALAGGYVHLCLLTEEGAVHCLGNNDAGQLGDDSLFARSPVPVMELVSAPLTSFRQAGPLVPEITTYIPTPLDISTEPAVVGTNLGLAAIGMIPFALAAELLTRIISSQGEALRKRLRLTDRLHRIKSPLERLKSLPLPGRLRFVIVVLFYGLTFSFLDHSWKPLTLTGIVLLLEMTLAYGIVGLAGDLTQWRAARRADLPVSLSIRPSNILLAVASTATSRLLKLVPGLMFGTPEALQIDERALDDAKRAWLQRLSALTLVGVGFGIWLPTALTAWLQSKQLPSSLVTILGGVEGFLLIIFAVSLENIFIQMLGFQNTLGQALQKRSRILWIASLVGVTFLFHHTLINPRGELAGALEVGNVRFFLSVIGVFVLSTLILWLYLLWKEKRPARTKVREAAPAPPISSPVEVLEPAPTGLMMPIPSSDEAPELAHSPTVSAALPTCATCNKSFNWEESFRQVNTPGSDPYNPPGSACYHPRTFCPHCGNLVADWHTTPTKDFDEWVWVGENQAINEGTSLPPSPILHGGGTAIPLQFTAYYDENRVDVERIKAYQETQMEAPKIERPLPWQEAYNQSFSLFHRGEVQASLEKTEEAIRAGLPMIERAAIHGAVGEHYFLNEREVETAYDYLQQSVATDPCGFWKAHFYLSLIHQARGENEQAEAAYRDARRFAQTVWFTPQVEAQAWAVIESWTPTVTEAVRIELPVGEEMDQLPVGEAPVEPSDQLPEGSKLCPQCAEVIKLEARICRYCRARFEILFKGYCLNCHAVATLDELERCGQCGAEVVDQHVESLWLEDAANVQPPLEPAPTPIQPPPLQIEVKPKLGKPPLWKSGRFWGATVLVLIGLTLVTYVLIGDTGWIPALIGASPTETQAAIASMETATPRPPTPMPTRIPTSKPTLTPTVTPIPAWVEEIAEPILNTIAQVPAHVISDFSTPAGGVYIWGCTDYNRCVIADGVMTVRSEGGDGGNVGGDALTAKDFVLTFELTPTLLVEGSNLGFGFRHSEAGFYGFALTFSNGAWDINKHWGRDERVEQPVTGEIRPIQVGETVTLLFIARGNQFAVYLNDKPLVYYEDDEFTSEWKGIGIHSSSGVTEVAFDNASFWDLSKLSGLP